MKKIRLLSIITTLIIIFLVCLFKDSDFKYYIDDNSNSISFDINSSMKELDKQNKYLFIFRCGETDGGEGSVFAVSRKRELYILNGFQNSYNRNSDEYSPDLKTNLVIYKKLSIIQYIDIKNKIKKCCDEYDKKNISKYLETYPPDWTWEAKIYFNKKTYMYAPEITFEGVNASYNYRHVRSEGFEPLNIPDICLFHNYIVNFINEAKSQNPSHTVRDGGRFSVPLL